MILCIPILLIVFFMSYKHFSSIDEYKLDSIFLSVLLSIFISIFILVLIIIISFIVIDSVGKCEDYSVEYELKSSPAYTNEYFDLSVNKYNKTQYTFIIEKDGKISIQTLTSEDVEVKYSDKAKATQIVYKHCDTNEFAKLFLIDSPCNKWILEVPNK